jgi:hypothetical protein
MTITDPAEAALFFAAYARGFHADPVTVPTAAEITAHPSRLRVWRGDGGRTMALVRYLTRPERRVDFAGNRYYLPEGSMVATALAREPKAALPALDGIDFCFVYAQDTALGATLTGRGWVPIATRTDGPALVTCYGRAMFAPLAMPLVAHDLASIAAVRRALTDA